MKEGLALAQPGAVRPSDDPLVPLTVVEAGVTAGLADRQAANEGLSPGGRRDRNARLRDVRGGPDGEEQC